MQQPPKLEPYAILVVDMVGYSRRLATQPIATHTAFKWNLCDDYWTLGEPERIVALLARQPDQPHVHRLFAASYARLGKLEVARRHAEKVREHQPGFSTRAWGQVVPFATSEATEEYADYLKRAGLSDAISSAMKPARLATALTVGVNSARIRAAAGRGAMAYALSDDSVRLYYEEAGSGEPIVFVHEFAGSYWSWEPQMRYFSRRHRCIVYAARGYPPSDVPDNPESYSQQRAAADIGVVMDATGIERAHIVGLSMGAFAALHFGLDCPQRALSLVCAGIGYGAHEDHQAIFRQQSEEVAQAFERQGSAALAAFYAGTAARVQFEGKDARGFVEFKERLARHSPFGAAHTMRGVQARRPSLYDLEDRLEHLAVPTLVVAGDEDDQTLLPGIFLKRTIPACGLLVLPKTGHVINLEEPDAFNRAVAEFLAHVGAGSWRPRDPRARPTEILKTS